MGSGKKFVKLAKKVKVLLIMVLFKLVIKCLKLTIRWLTKVLIIFLKIKINKIHNYKEKILHSSFFTLINFLFF